VLGWPEHLAASGRERATLRPVTGEPAEAGANGRDGTPTSDAVLFEDVRIFDGRGANLSGPSHVLVRGNTIGRISPDPIAVDSEPEVRIIAADGRVLIPGLIDAHWHSMVVASSEMILLTADPAYTQFVAARAAEATLMRGFTTVRDLGGPVFGLKRAIDEGVIVGPRIYPSGAVISQTSGHGDFRTSSELPRVTGGPLSRSEVDGFAAIADSPDEIRLRAREQLRRGASQIKLMGGGGVASPYNPIESTQYTEAEIRAAVEAAENWGTYVTVHAYTPRAVQQALRAGARCIEHGQLVDEATVEMMAAAGAWWSLQPLLGDEDQSPLANPVSQAKAQTVYAGTANAYELARKHGVRTAFGTDVLFDADLARTQGRQLAKLVRWYSAADVLKMATADNGELMALSGFSNPYPGRLGVVEEGALADLLLLDGDPLADISLIGEPVSSIRVIMKDGTIYKNSLPR
jgi:imidazolonepropionase-like amidohydrolase